MSCLCLGESSVRGCLRVPLWHSGLRIRHCHCSYSSCCCGTGLIPGPGTSECDGLGTAPPLLPSKKVERLFLFLAVIKVFFFFWWFLQMLIYLSNSGSPFKNTFWCSVNLVSMILSILLSVSGLLGIKLCCFFEDSPLPVQCDSPMKITGLMYILKYFIFCKTALALQLFCSLSPLFPWQ